MGLPLVVSDYRSKGILKRYKVTPVSPSMILAVQVTIYTLYAAVSLILLYAEAVLFFGYQFRGSFLSFWDVISWSLCLCSASACW